LRARAKKIFETVITTDLFEIANISALDFDGPLRRGRSIIIKNTKPTTRSLLSPNRNSPIL